MKRVLVITIIILMILTSFPAMEGGGGQTGSAPLLNDPVQPPDGGTVYVNGTWNVTDNRQYKNCTIILTGNLTIENGGSLELINTTLRMNSSSTVKYYIEVLSGGSINIHDYDGNSATTGDASTITRNNVSNPYFFRAYEGSYFEMKNSNLFRCGDATTVPKYAGLYVNTDNAVIDHCNFSYNYDGLVLYNSDAVVSNNTFYWNGHSGIYAGYWSDATIENNLILSNQEYGIWVDGGSNTDPQPSNPLIINNRILDTGRGSYTAVGIQITTYSSPVIKNNQIIGSTEDGIYAGQWCQAVIINNTIDNLGGNIGIASSAPRDLIITNCTINNTAIYSLSLSQAYFILTNTSFNGSAGKIKFWDSTSNLTVRNYLHIHVNDSTGKPIPNATVHITDNANGTYDRNFTTDENGYVKWIVLTDYWQNSTTTINYSDYTVSVSYPGVSFIDNNRSVKMNISKTEYFTAEPEPRTATATGPTNSAPSNTADITITYINSTDTSSVGLYYTADNGSTWTFIGNDTSIDGLYAWTIPADGVYGWMAVGDDESAPAGGERPEASSYSYDGTPPEITAAYPPDGAVNVSVVQPVIIDFSEPVSTTTFDFTCEPDPGGWTESWNATDGRVSLGHADFSVNTTYWINVTSANDTAGNALAGVYSFRFTTEVPDTAVPSITITSPQDNALFNSSSVTIAWSGSDDGTGIDHYEVRMDGGAWENVSTNTSCDFTGLSDGPHTVDVKAVDNASNEAADSVTFTVDTTAPAVSITSPAAGAIFNTSSVGVEWAASDTTSGINHCKIRVDGGAWMDVGTNATCDFTGLFDGTHTVYVRAVDSASNGAIDSVTFTVDTSAPAVSITSPAAGEIFNTSSITAQWTGSDSTSGINHYEVRADGGSWRNIGTNMSCEFIALFDGQHTGYIKAVDDASNEVIDYVMFTVDTTAPTITGRSPTGRNVSLNSTVSVTFSEPMDISSVRVNISGVTGTMSWSGRTAVFTPGRNFTAGTLYFVNVTGKDTAGNALAPYSWSFTTENETPATTAHTGNISGVVTDENGSPVAGAIVTVQGTNISTVTDSAGRFLLENITAGSYNLTVSGTGFENTTMPVTVTEGENSVVHAMLSPVGSEPPADQFPWWILALAALVIVAAALVKKGKKTGHSEEDEGGESEEEQGPGE